MMFPIFIICALPFLTAIAAGLEIIWDYDDTLRNTGYRKNWEGGDA